MVFFSFAILGSIMPFPNEEGTARDTKGNDNFNFKIFSNVTYKIQRGDNKQCAKANKATSILQSFEKSCLKIGSVTDHES